MTTMRDRASLTLCAIMLVISAGGCALLTKADPETKVPKKPLHAKPPAINKLELAASSDGGRLRPAAGATAPSPIMSPAVVPLPPEVEVGIRRAAEQDARVVKELGARFAYFLTEHFEAGNILCPTAPQALTLSSPPAVTRLTYFSYSNNVAVVVCMRGERFESVGRRKGYQPAESDEEVDQAVELASKDSRLANKLEGLTGHAILMEPEEGWIRNEPGFGDRVLWVTFERKDTGDPQYWAIVDLTTQRVLDAGTEPKP